MLIKKLICTLLILGCLPAAAQTASDSLLLRDYRFVKYDDPWLTQRNASALTRLAANSIVMAEGSLTKADGGFVDYAGSDNVLQANVQIESFYRLSRRTVVFGAISYDNWSGKDMTGSAFIHPERMPFGLVEDSLTNAGRKHLDTYCLSGGLGVDVWKGYSLGVRLDYQSANYAKYKDLRHKNKLMDLQLSAGVYAPLTCWLNVGANYTYHRKTESITFGTYGKSEKVYKTLIDYGGFFGRAEQFGNEGYTDKTREMPLFEETHGAAFQLGIQATSQLSFLGTFAFSHGDGYYGRRSPYTITYTGHERDITGFSAAIRYAAASSRHHLTFTYQQEKLTNQAETYRELTNDNGAQYYEYFDPVTTGNKKWYDISLDYTVHLGVQHEMPTWTLSATYQWNKRRQTAYLYPFFRWQLLSSNEVSLSAQRNLLTRRGVWSLQLHGSYGKGSGDPYRDGTFATPSSQQEQPATMEAFLMREYQYLTAAHYLLGGSVQYAFRFPGTRLKTHARLSFDYRKANETDTYTLGNHRTRATLAMGCTF